MKTDQETRKEKVFKKNFLKVPRAFSTQRCAHVQSLTHLCMIVAFFADGGGLMMEEEVVCFWFRGRTIELQI